MWLPLCAQSGPVFELTWLVLWGSGQFCLSWAEDKNMCVLLMLSPHACTHAARAEKGEHSCAHFGENQHFSNRWNGCVEVKIGLATLEVVHSCSTLFSWLESGSPDTFSAVSVSRLLRSPAWFSTRDRYHLHWRACSTGTDCQAWGWGWWWGGWVTVSVCVMSIVLMNIFHVKLSLTDFLLVITARKVNQHR